MASQEHLEKLKIARAHDLSAVIESYCERTADSPERAEQVADELRHFLVLCLLDKGDGFAIRDPVDEMWHTFLLFTKDYFHFCHSLGKRYLHHEPVGKNKHDPVAAAKRLESYKHLLTSYEIEFGYPPPHNIWPVPIMSIMKGPDCGKGCSYFPPCCNKP